jgi:MinD-like ATPase involved in chromosome partitioning or flagellar assembly
VVIAVSPVRPGCGATTVAALLASFLAGTLREPPLAIDADLESRSLSLHLDPRRRLSPEAYADVVDGRLRLGEAALAAQGPYAVALLPAPERAGPPPDAAACTALLARLREGGGVVMLDCPAGFQTSWGQAAWAAADQFVLVADGRSGHLDGLAPAATTLAGAGIAVAAVANRSPLRGQTVRAAAALGLDGPVVALPDDAEAAAELRLGRLPWEAAPRAWQRGIAHLASALAARWS